MFAHTEARDGCLASFFIALRLTYLSSTVIGYSPGPMTAYFFLLALGLQDASAYVVPPYLDLHVGFNAQNSGSQQIFNRWTIFPTQDSRMISASGQGRLPITAFLFFSLFSLNRDKLSTLLFLSWTPFAPLLCYSPTQLWQKISLAD